MTVQQMAAEEKLQCLCGSSQYTCVWQSKQDDTRLLRCDTCGLKRTYPVPLSGRSNPIYQDTELVYPIKDYIANKDLWCFFASKILREVHKHKTTGKLLDVGCFIGILLETAREQGWETYGVEINSNASKFACKEFGLNVFNGELAEAQFPDRFFDAIVCNHVLEHIDDPPVFLQEVKRVLRPDGILIIGIPNANSWIARYYAHRWYSLGPDQHIWQFCPKTVKATLERSDFQLKALTTDLLWYEYQRNLKGLVKWTLFQTIRVLGKGDAILIAASPSNK